MFTFCLFSGRFEFYFRVWHLLTSGRGGLRILWINGSENTETEIRGNRYHDLEWYHQIEGHRQCFDIFDEDRTAAFASEIRHSGQTCNLSQYFHVLRKVSHSQSHSDEWHNVDAPQFAVILFIGLVAHLESTTSHYITCKSRSANWRWWRTLTVLPNAATLFWWATGAKLFSAMSLKAVSSLLIAIISSCRAKA